jgi:hypothetical protein
MAAEKRPVDEAVEFIWSLQKEAAQRGILNIWTIYDHPADFPDGFVARRFKVMGGVPLVTDDIVQGDLSIIRGIFWGCGLHCIERDATDEAQIVESWL